jgi:hypothetical protein
LTGLCDSFDGYTDFLKSFNIVFRAVNESKISINKDYDNNKLNSEWTKINEIKNFMEQEIQDEIANFINLYSDEFSEIIEKFKILLIEINTEEFKILSKYY